MTLAEVCDYTGYKRRNIQYHSEIGSLRSFNRNGEGRFRRWYKKDVDAWLRGEPVQEAS
jgi:predicted DNA-binding transcriptional regulator AlpA